MAKYKLPNSEGTKLDPFAFEKQFATPLSNNSSASGVADQLEFATPVSIEEGYGGLGNSADYLNAYNETQFREQGALELIAKGVGRTLAKAGTEVLKIPGYVGGGINAAGNELFGDGKNSMSLAVDNAWINQFESLDEGLKSLMPVHISQDIQDGNLIDKASSGAWWATQGADGAGFMLSMFVPGAATKLLGTGKALASLTEVLANTRAGKLTLNAAKALKFNNASLDIAGLADDTFHISNSFARNADGVTAALMNTTLESMAEAGDTFKQSYNSLKDKVRSGEMSDEEARSQAGAKASSVFKSNMALLMVSNLLEQNYIWKAFDSKGESLISQVTKNGKIDFDALSKLGNKGYKELALEFGSGIAKNAAKEGIFEEGLQTTIQQNALKGREGLGNAVSDLGSQIVNGVFNGDDTFWNNKELHESMFLGAALGAGMGFIGQIKENNDLRRQLNGYDRSTESLNPIMRFAQKAGFKRPSQDSKGLVSLIKDSWIKNFKTDYQSLLNEDGSLNETKVKIAFEQPNKELAVHALYDAAIAAKDDMLANKYSNYLAQHYVQPFLGQVGMDKVFTEHVKNQVVPAWQERFEAVHKRSALPEEVSKFQSDFTQSGERVFKAYNEAERTNYPERYFKGKDSSPQEYAKFRQDYFNAKFDTLLQLDSLNLTRTKLQEDLNKSGLLSKVTMEDGKLKAINSLSATEQIDVNQYNKVVDKLDKESERLNEMYSKFFTKDGVKEIYDISNEKDEVDLEEENKDLKEKIEEKKAKVENIVAQAEKLQEEEKPVILKNNDTGKTQTVQVTPEGLSNGETIIPKDEVVKSTIVSDAEQSVNNDEEVIFQKIAEDLKSNNTVEDEKGSPILISDKTTKEDIERRRREELDEMYETSEGWVTTKTRESAYTGFNTKAVLERKINDKYDAELNALNQLISDPQDIIEPEQPHVDVTDELIELGKLNTTDRITTGRHIVYDKIPGGGMFDRLTDEGLPTLGTIEQQRWQNHLDKINQSNEVLLSTIGHIKETNPELYNQIIKSADGIVLNDNDVWSILLKDGKPVMDNNSFVFTSIYTPDVMYKDMNNIRVTKEYIRSVTGKEIPSDPVALRQFDIDSFKQAKEDYTKWYNSIVAQKSVSLTIKDVTLGHQLTKRDKQGNPIWNPAFGNIPGKVKLEVSVNGQVNINGQLLKVAKGDVVATSEHGVYPLKQKNLSVEESNLVIEMIKQVTPDTNLENLRVDGSFFVNDFENASSIGLFFDSKQIPLIRHLINWGGKGNYSIRIGKGNRTVEFTIGEQTSIVQISELSNKESSDYKRLLDFLQKKRFNVNNNLLGQKAKQVQFKNEQFSLRPLDINYDEFLLKEKLETTSLIHKDYPPRLQRNIVLGSPSLTKVEEVKTEKKSRREIAKQADLSIDKVLTVEQMLEQKILSGEIKKLCK